MDTAARSDHVLPGAGLTRGGGRAGVPGGRSSREVGVRSGQVAGGGRILQYSRAGIDDCIAGDGVAVAAGAAVEDATTGVEVNGRLRAVHDGVGLDCVVVGADV